MARSVATRTKGVEVKIKIVYRDNAGYPSYWTVLDTSLRFRCRWLGYAETWRGAWQHVRKVLK